MSVYFAQQQSGRSRLKAGRNAPQHATTGDMKPQQRSGQLRSNRPDPVHTPLSRPIATYTLVTNALRRYAPQQTLSQRAASREILSQAYVMEWPPKLLTNPVLLSGAKLARKSWRMCNSTVSTTRVVPSPCSSMGKSATQPVEYPALRTADSIGHVSTASKTEQKSAHDIQKRPCQA